VTDRVLLSASPANISACAALAAQRDLGIELMAFAYPDVLDGDWRGLVTQYKALLAPIARRSMHGPFFDMAPGSLDRQVNALVMSRYRQALDIAAELSVQTIVFHANFIAALRTANYRDGWTARNIDFFGQLAPYAGERGVTIALENMWEFDPAIITGVLTGVNHPSLRACLDVGHAHLFSAMPLTHWLAVVRPHLAHVHLNNNDGLVDVHRALPDGVLDYQRILPELRALNSELTITLEMDRTEDMIASFPYLQLE
jgi:sugar phosphate isomerase/epimerase